MSKVKEDRIKYCNKCYVCVNDCKQIEEVYNCEYFSKGFTITDYNKMIHEDNVNLKKMCNKYGISTNVLYKMLKGRYNLTFKYRKILDEVLFEDESMQKYIERFEVEDGER